MNTIVEHINSVGHTFVEFALPMLIQSSVLIVVLLLADLLLRKKVKAVFRYWIWMLVLVKLVLPTSLSSPLSLGYFFGDKLTYQDLAQTTSALESAEPAPAVISPGINPIYIKPNAFIQPTVPVIPGVEQVAAGPVGPPAVSVTPLSWQGVVFLVWLAVVIAMGLLLLQRALFVRGLVTQAKEANRLMNDALGYCCERMGMKGKVGLKVSANATSPSVCGLIRPVILLPRNLPSSLGASRLRAVLMHELAHIKRGDLWVNLAQTVLQIVYFYNPLLWLANAIIRRVREQAIDETVLVAMGAKAQQYPQTLVDVAKLAFKRPALSLRLIGVVESESALAGRIKHILGRPMPKSAKLGVLGLAAVLIIGAILLPMAKAEHYTDHSHQIVKLARQEARQLNHEYVGTEHILLALVKEGRGVSGIVLRRLDVDIEKVRFEVRKLVRSGPEVVATKRLPKTPRAKRAMKYAVEEAKVLGHDYIGAEHVLLGLLREKDGVAAQTLMKLGLTVEGVRREVSNVVGPKPRKSGYPTLVISGVVTDAATENPIAGARVGDDGYGPKPYRGAVTDSDGRYYYLTWPEHHGIKAQAAGYKGRRKSLYEGHFTFNKEMVEEVFDFALEDVAEASKFKATLSNGVTVELVGICEHPSEGKQWWRPDGTELLREIRVKKSGTVAAGGKAFAFVAKVNGPEDMTFKWGEIDGSYGGASLEVVGSQGQVISNMRAQKVYIDENLTTTSMRLGAAAGNWETKAEHDGSGMISIGHGEWGITFSKAFQPGKETKLIVSDDLLEYSHRIVAIDLDGNLHTPARRSWGSAGKMRQTTVDFNMSLDEIKEFRFQTRPYQWVEFKNVSLRPGFETDVQIKTENNIQAPPLKDFERKLIEKVLDLVKQVEKKYPNQATHWPAGPGLYHVDAQGHVTIWHYQLLWHRSTDCAEDEVGWGSSQLVNAKGMYYLPDGTPLQSRWRERGGGMKDIRVKVGRTIDENERVAVIHRHSLPSNHDLLSRDGLERKILLDSWKGLPLAIIIRVDRPMRLDGWWLGDVETDSQHFNEYDQLIVNGPPGNNNKPMLVTVGLPETEVQVEAARAEKTASQQLSFGPVTERVLSFNFFKDSAHLDLDTGRYGKEQPGRDLIAAAGESDGRVRAGLDMVAIPVEARRWESSPQEVLGEVAKGKPQRQARLGGPESRRTFFFKTREGSVGVLQILPLQDSSGQVKVRYKLVQGRQDVKETESKNITRHRGAFKINEEMPVNLDCPAVKDVWGRDQRPFKVETVEFVKKEERLHCSVKIGGATTADGKFIVRVNIRGKESRDSAREVLLAVREFLFETQCFSADRPLLIGEVQDLDFGSIHKFAMATSFEVVIEDITQRVAAAKQGVNVTTFRGAFKKGEPMPVKLDCPAVKDPWGNVQKPFKVETVEFAEKDDHLHCSVKIDGTTAADGKFIVWVKIYDRESRDSASGEGIVDLRGFLFQTHCVYRGFTGGIRKVQNLDFGPVFMFEDATSFEVEIVDITRKAESAEESSESDVEIEIERAGEKSVPALGVVAAGAFEELSVKFGGIWMHWQDVEFTVRGDGSVEFSMNIGPRDKTKYKTAFKLSGEHLAELSGLLRKTNWLTAPGANVQPGFSDATRIDMKLMREGKTNEAWCHDRNAEPYLALIIFLKRIQRQEYLLYQMTVPGALDRHSSFSDVYQQIRAEKGEPVSAHPHRILDFGRFVPVLIDVITHPDDNHYETVAIAARILGKLRAEQVRPQITDLTTAERKEHHTAAAVIRTGYIRTAAVEALTELGGEQARRHVRDMAKNHRSWRRQVNEALVEGLLELDRGNCVELLKDMASTTKNASWGLIRLGPAALPTIVEILEVRDTRYMGQIYLIRQYIDNWEKVAKPIDPRVIEAVQRNLDYRLGRGPGWTQYHKEFLQLAGAPELPSKDARQIAEEFLAAVKANDQMTIGAVAEGGGGSWPQRLANMKEMPELKSLKITRVYADKAENMAFAVAAVPGDADSNSVYIYLNFISGAVWRIANIAHNTPQIAERMLKRYLENHPNAKPVPAGISGGPGVETEVKPAANEAGPRITFENLVCDLGQVAPRTKNVCEFKFTNTGNALLIITRVGAACACTTSIPQKKKEYAPGESGTLKVTYQSGARAGRVTKSVFVYSNASVNPVKLTIKAEIVVKVAHEPERLNLVLDKENAGCPAITLTSLDNQPFTITGFKSTGDFITTDFDPSVKEASFVLQPKVDMEKLRKDPRGSIEISVTHPECKKVTIIYNMLPEFKVDPRVIYVRDAEPRKPVTKKVSVLSNYNEDFEIESTSSKKETVKVLSKQKVRNGYQFELQITPPDQETKRRVFTDVFTVMLKGGEELQVTCYGIYPRKAAGPSEESARRTDVQDEGADKTLVLKPGTKTDMQGEVEKAGKNLYTSKTWQAAFYEAERIIRTRQTWPETPEALAKAFWKARALKDYKEMEILWPGSGSWNWAEICKNDPAVNYVFGKARKDNPSVSYASEEYFAENQSYNLTMRISSLSTKKGKRYYITSGN